MTRVFVISLVVATGCHHAPPPPAPVVEPPVQPLPVEPPWVGTLAAVQVQVDSGRFATADSILAAFQVSQAGTAEATESAFWRVLLRVDPRNPAFTPADARAALEAYIDSDNAKRRTEAAVMLRMLALSDSLRAAQVVHRSATEVRDRSREDELQKLRDELQKTQAELDRIKRRLGPVKP
jgi:hypothetical protein